MNGETAGSGEPGPSPLTFEEALGRLEQIVRDLEGSDLTLEETLARYEEGSWLVKECARRLEDAEQRIRVLTAAREEGKSPQEDRIPHPGPGRAEPEGEPGDGDDLPF